MEYLSLGKIIGSFGLDGTLKVFSTSNNEEMRYKKGNKVFLFNEKEDARNEYEVISYRISGKFTFVKLKGIDNPEIAESFKGNEIQVIKDRNDLKEGYFYFSDLKDCVIVDKDNKEYGKVKEVEEFPAQITLRVFRRNGKDFFIPFVKDFIKQVDIQNKKIIVNIIEGML